MNEENEYKQTLERIRANNNRRILKKYEEKIDYRVNHSSIAIMCLIFHLLKKDKMLTRKQIAEKLNIARTTIYDNLKKLEKLFLIKKQSFSNGKRGRPLIFWSLLSYNIEKAVSSCKNQYFQEIFKNIHCILLKLGIVRFKNCLQCFHYHYCKDKIVKNNEMRDD